MLTQLFIGLLIATTAHGGICYDPATASAPKSCEVSPTATSRTGALIVNTQGSSEKFLFSFEPSLDCAKIEGNPHYPNVRAECLAAGQKNWSTDERLLVEGAMRSLVSNPKLALFFPALAKKGPTKIFRATKHDGELSGANTYAYKSVSHDGLVVTDYFFDQAKRWLRECQGFIFEDAKKQIEWIILHELAHEFASRQGGLDDDCSFLKAIGWNSDSDSFTEISSAEIQKLREQGVALMKAGKDREAAAWTTNQAQKFGFPTLYAMTSPEEGFAELLSFYALDDKASSYMKPAVRRWFDRNLVAKSKRAKSCPIKEM